MFPFGILAAGSTVGVGLSVVGSVVNPPTLNVATYSNQTARFYGATYPGAVVYLEVNGDGGYNLIASSTPNGSGDWFYDSGTLNPGNYNVDAYTKFSGVDSVKTSKEYFVITQTTTPSTTTTEIVVLNGAVPLPIDIRLANVDLSVLGQYVILFGTRFPYGDTSIKVEDEQGYKQDIKILVKQDGNFFYTVNNLKTGSYKISIISSTGQVRSGNFFIAEDSSKDIIQTIKKSIAPFLPFSTTTEGTKFYMPGEVKTEPVAEEAPKITEEKSIPKTKVSFLDSFKKYLTRGNIVLFFVTIVALFLFFFILFYKKRKKEEEKEKNY